MNVASPRSEKNMQYGTGRLVTAAALLLGWAVVAVQSQLDAIDRVAQANVPAAAERLVWLTKIVAFAVSLGILVTGAWLWRFGHRVVRAGHFPPPETKIVRPTRIYTGSKAKVLGWIAQIVGLLVMGLGTLATWLFVQLAEVLLRG